MLLLLLAALLAGCGGARNVGVRVRRIEVAPWPGGARLIVSTDGSGRALLAAVRGAVPTPFPPNPPQSCHLGTVIVIAAARTHRYGPCGWPAAIEKLRRALVGAALARHHAGHNPATGQITASRWKAVLNDWYDGRMDHWHSCAAMREAIRHLPNDPGAYSTVFLDLQAYARGVCWDPAQRG